MFTLWQGTDSVHVQSLHRICCCKREWFDAHWQMPFVGFLAESAFSNEFANQSAHILERSTFLAQTNQSSLDATMPHKSVVHVSDLLIDGFLDREIQNLLDSAEHIFGL